MVVHASYSYEHSLNGLEAFQVGPYGEKNGREWSYIAEGAISGKMLLFRTFFKVSMRMATLSIRIILVIIMKMCPRL
ncbi:hypothetical protein ACOSP7_020037 [Xanthoceras sorbifolium]